jgi:hypothetical protein
MCKTTNCLVRRRRRKRTHGRKGNKQENNRVMGLSSLRPVRFGAAIGTPLVKATNMFNTYTHKHTRECVMVSTVLKEEEM